MVPVHREIVVGPWTKDSAEFVVVCMVSELTSFRNDT